MSEPGLHTRAPACNNLLVAGTDVPYICLAVASLYGGSQRHLLNSLSRIPSSSCPSVTKSGSHSEFISTAKQEPPFLIPGTDRLHTSTVFFSGPKMVSIISK